MTNKNSNEIPVQKVIAMRKQNLSDNQIIQTLQQEGISSQNVLEALEMADMGKVGPDLSNQNFPQTPMQNNPQSVSPPGNAIPPQVGQSNLSPPGTAPSLNQNNFSAPNQMQPPESGSHSNKETDEDVEELIEAIIEEKWAQVEKDINRVLDWKESVDEKIGAIQQDVKNLKTDFDDLHKAILGKIGDYDKNILNVGTQLKAMEEVFSKVLPTFTDNVTELNRITEKLKSK